MGVNEISSVFSTFRLSFDKIRYSRYPQKFEYLVKKGSVVNAVPSDT